MGDELLCPACDRSHGADARFCEDCGMPLVHPGAAPEPTARQRRARKIKPQYTEGRLVKVAEARNQPQAEFLAGLLLEEGIPSMVRRSQGFDVPEAMVGGARDVLVPESGAQAAREALTWQHEAGREDVPAQD
ncbi:MAG TPA: DUF2007 domain-containing protein [Solirubrobacteraceae bacterium]|jgi:hypothetical protein|nr:DUF2007 domain-containing protein [Solirubrobacteraceae bacterium]